MNTDTVERIDSAPRLQAFEIVDRENADAAWEHHEWREGCLRLACQSIRALGVYFTAADLFQILSTAESTLYVANQPELAEQVGSFACEVE